MCNVVFVNDIAGQSAVLRDGKSLLFRPGTYFPAAFTARSRSGPSTRPLGARPACMVHKRGKQSAELHGMPGAQVYLVVHAIEAELHRLVGGTASEIIL